MKKQIDYVKLFAEKLREDNKYFAQQKLLIDSQIIASRTLLHNAFSPDFKKSARDYLRKRGILNKLD
ncbi:MAG: hypothetical protein AABX51_02635 [Nanoarchaeota archaeon]